MPIAVRMNRICIKTFRRIIKFSQEVAVPSKLFVRIILDYGLGELGTHPPIPILNKFEYKLFIENTHILILEIVLKMSIYHT